MHNQLLQPPDLGRRGVQRPSFIQRLHDLLKGSRHEEFRCELTRAESKGEISEFYALSFHAILAIVEGSELASDYLEMAEAVAGSPYERLVATENWATYDLWHALPRAAVERCLATLDHLCQNEQLWKDLLIALCRLGDIESIEATLRSLTQHGYSQRLVRSFTSTPATNKYS
jgi:hypothetical protein